MSNQTIAPHPDRRVLLRGQLQVWSGDDRRQSWQVRSAGRRLYCSTRWLGLRCLAHNKLPKTHPRVGLKKLGRSDIKTLSFHLD